MQLHLLLPIVIPAAAAIMILIHLVLIEESTGLWWFTLLVLANSIIAVFVTGTGDLPLLRFTRSANLAAAFLLCALLGSFVCLDSYLGDHRQVCGEWCFFYLSSAVGALTAVYAVDLLMFYVGLEIALVSMIFLVSPENWFSSVELMGRFLYFNLFSSLIVILSFIFYYFHSGSMSLTGQKIAAGDAETFLLFLFLALVLKLGLGPFYFLAVDFFHGAPLPVSLALATTVRGCGLFFFVKTSRLLLEKTTLAWSVVVGGIAVGGTLVAALHAHAQNNSRRKLAGLLTSRWGLVLVPLVAAGSPVGLRAAQFALPVLILTLLLAAAGFIYFESNTESGDREAAEPSALKGVQRSLVSMLVAGVPPAAGFAALFLTARSVVIVGLTPILLAYLPVFLINVLLAVEIFTEFELDSPAYYGHGKSLDSPRAAGVVVVFSLVGLVLLGLWPGLIFEVGPAAFG